MEVPKHIKDSIVKSAKHRAIADEENEKIRDWIDENGLGANDFLIEMLIECIEVNNNPNALIHFLEKDVYRY